jgi:hypothetical protein
MQPARLSMHVDRRGVLRRSTRQHAALRTERQVAQFVQDDEIGMDNARSDLSESALHLPQLERIDQFDCREATDASEMVETCRFLVAAEAGGGSVN